jgi:DNA-directed RNA polymerase specialized sigma24 family protein
MRATTVVKDIERFVWWLAHRSASSAWLMDADEIAGELFLEISKGLEAYSDKEGEELLAILRTMCDNRVYELKAKYYGTHRRLKIEMEISLESIDDPDDDDFAASYPLDMISEDTSDSLYESHVRVLQTRASLSDNAKIVFDAVCLDNNPRVTEQVRLAGIRASATYKGGGTVRLKPWHLAEALGMSENSVRRAWKEIRDQYRRVVNNGL